jgi:NADPH:quinone reductase-like Zn-dependent oxidoreductase
LVRRRIVGLISAPNGADLAALAELMASGKVASVVRDSYPLARAADAVEAAGEGRGGGTPVVVL